MTVLCALLGVALGLAYFLALKASLRFSGRPPAMVAAALLRLAVAGGGFWAAAQAGAAPLLAALGGFLAGRWVLMRRLG